MAGINGQLGELERNYPGLVRFTGGLHRVVFYGDYIPAVERMGRLMGFRVVKEI